MTAMTEAIEAAGVVELQRKLPTIQAELDRMEDALISRVFSSIEARELTPDQAYFAWLELLSYRQLTRRLTARVKIGQVDVDKLTKGGK